MNDAGVSKNMRNDVFTTGQVASICNVSPRIVTKWIDSGVLTGYRVPMSQDRRVTMANLERFLKGNEMSTSLYLLNWLKAGGRMPTYKPNKRRKKYGRSYHLMKKE